MQSKISKDRMLELATEASIRPHSLYLYSKIDKNVLAQCLVDAGRIYHCRELSEIPIEYLVSIINHERTHIIESWHTGFNILALYVDLASHSRDTWRFIKSHFNTRPSIKCKALMPQCVIPFIQNLTSTEEILDKTWVPLSEASAIYEQINHHKTPADLRMCIIDDLVHEKRVLDQYIKLDDVVEKIRSKHTKSGINHAECKHCLTFSEHIRHEVKTTFVRTIFENGPAIRINKIVDSFHALSENDIPCWSNIDELKDFFRKEIYTCIGIEENRSIDLFSRLWFALFDSIINYMHNGCYSAFLEKYIFGICNTLIASDYPSPFPITIYSGLPIKDQEIYILGCDKAGEPLSDPPFFFIPKWNRLAQAYDKLVYVYKETLSKCPGQFNCQGKNECRVLGQFYNKLKKAWKPLGLKCSLEHEESEKKRKLKRASRECG